MIYTFCLKPSLMSLKGFMFLDMCQVYATYFVLWLVNFCESMRASTTLRIDTTLNSYLEGYAIYYGLYSQSEKYYGQLYDYRTIAGRLYIIVLHYLFPSSRCFERKLFTYEDITANLDNLKDLSINAAMVTYVSNGMMHDRLLVCGSSSNSSSEPEPNANPKPTFKFIYVIVGDDKHQLDVTSYFNRYIDALFASSTPLTYHDTLNIFVGKYNLDIDMSRENMVIKACSDITFQDMVFKDNDILDITAFQ